MNDDDDGDDVDVMVDENEIDLVRIVTMMTRSVAAADFVAMRMMTVFVVVVVGIDLDDVLMNLNWSRVEMDDEHHRLVLVGYSFH